MTIVKNIAAGPRGIHLADGTLMMLEPGQTSEDVKLAEGEQEDTDPTWFQFDGEIKAAPEPVEGELTAFDPDALANAIARADAAEARIDALVAENDDLKAKIAAFDPDGDGKPGGAVGGEPADDGKVSDALALLDPASDDDWTKAGLPSVESVASLAGGRVTREQIARLAPDLTRDTAPKS